MPEPVRPDPGGAARRRVREAPPPVYGFTPWFAFLGGPAAWALHLLVAYALTEIACRSDRLDATILGVRALDLFGVLVTLVAALTAIAAAVVAFALAPGGLRADPVDDVGAPEGLGRQRFMSYGGMLMNGLFTVAILFAGLPFLFLRACS
jgi:hypothetical protein